MEDSNDINNFDHVREQPSPEDIHSMYSIGKLLGNENQYSRLKSVGLLCMVATLVFVVTRTAAPWLTEKYKLPGGVIVETLLHAFLISVALGGAVIIKTYR
jgi:hypothetical protein